MQLCRRMGKVACYLGKYLHYIRINYQKLVEHKIFRSKYRLEDICLVPIKSNLCNFLRKLSKIPK